MVYTHSKSFSQFLEQRFDSEIILKKQRISPIFQAFSRVVSRAKIKPKNRENDQKWAYLLFICLFSSSLMAEQIKFERTRLHIVGSSTVFPFVSTVAEHFGVLTRFKTPLIEMTGTGSGMHIFCRGKGEKTPDIVSASRPMSHAEKKMCATHHTGKILSWMIGKDGLVFVSSKKSPIFHLNRHTIFSALSAVVQKDGQWILNPYKRWSDIDARLPCLPIKILGTPPTAGSYDVLISKGLKSFCKEGHMRQDGVYLSASEHSNVIIQKVLNDPGAVGVVSYHFYKQHQDYLNVMHIDGVAPTVQTIKDGCYFLVYPLYLYFKQSHLKHLEGLEAFMRYFEKASQAQGFLGLISSDISFPRPIVCFKSTTTNNVSMSTKTGETL